MFQRSTGKSSYLSFIASMLLAFVISFAPVQAVSADSSTSDLSIRLISAPKTAKSCQVFQAEFQITNLGPDEASGIFVSTSVPDQLGTLELLGVPDTLAVGESVTVTAVMKVVAFGPNDSRSAWVGAGMSADPYPDTSFDPNWANNNIVRSLKLVGKPEGVCP